MKRPPQKAVAFLRWFCREDYLEEIEGDLTEIFQKECDVAPHIAKWKFMWRVMKYLRPGFIRSFKHFRINNIPMIRHNVLIAYRNVVRHKSSLLHQPGRSFVRTGLRSADLPMGNG